MPGESTRQQRELREVNKALRDNPKSISLHKARSELLRGMGKGKAANVASARAKALYEQDLRDSLASIDTKLKEGKLNAGLDMMRKEVLAELEGRGPKSYPEAKAAEPAKDMDFPTSISRATKALQASPNDMKLQDELAFLLIRSGKAIAELERLDGSIRDNNGVGKPLNWNMKIKLLNGLGKAEEAGAAKREFGAMWMYAEPINGYIMTSRAHDIMNAAVGKELAKDTVEHLAKVNLGLSRNPIDERKKIEKVKLLLQLGREAEVLEYVGSLMKEEAAVEPSIWQAQISLLKKHGKAQEAQTSEDRFRRVWERLPDGSYRISQYAQDRLADGNWPD